MISSAGSTYGHLKKVAVSRDNVNPVYQKVFCSHRDGILKRIKDKNNTFNSFNFDCTSGLDTSNVGTITGISI